MGRHFLDCPISARSSLQNARRNVVPNCALAGALPAALEAQPDRKVTHEKVGISRFGTGQSRVLVTLFNQGSVCQSIGLHKDEPLT